MESKKDYFTVKELADLTGVSRVTVFNRIKRGEVRAEKIGRNYIIYWKNLPNMLNPFLTKFDKDNIERGVKRALHDYGDAIKMLGKE